MSITTTHFLGLVILCHVFSSDAATHYSIISDSCHIIGDTDLYGIGIRLGLYLGWASLVVASLIAPSQSRPAGLGAFVITVSMLVSMATSPSQDRHAVYDVVIVWYETTVLFTGLVLDIFCSYRLAISVAIFALMSLSGRRTRWLLTHWKEVKCHPEAGPLVSAFYILMGLQICAVLAFIVMVAWPILLVGREPMGIRRWDQQTTRLWKRCAAHIFAISCGVVAIVNVEVLIKKADIDLSAASWKRTSQLIPLIGWLLNFSIILWNGIKTGILQDRRQEWPIIQLFNNIKLVYQHQQGPSRQSSEVLHGANLPLRAHEDNSSAD